MTEIYLVRHGQASFGSDNYDKLSELGHQQSIWLGEYFTDKGLSFDQVVTGSLVRHQETAQGIMQGMKGSQEFHTLAGINEFDFQSIFAAYLAKHPDATPPADAPRSSYYKLLKKGMKAWSEGAFDDLNEAKPAESWKDFSNRVLESFLHIQNNFHGDKVLVVSSGGVIAMILSLVLNSSTDSVIELNLQTKNTSVSHFYFNPKAMRLTAYNGTPHLDSNDKQQYITFS
jgi:broad specificity phosphatase PhoE